MIVYYDGVCALCNGFVRWVLRRDRKRRFQFAPLAGARAAELRRRFPETAHVDSIILEAEDGVLAKSDALLRIARELGGPWSAARLLRALPRRWRDALYDLIARHRYGVFGQLDACPLPPAAERERFLP